MDVFIEGWGMTSGVDMELTGRYSYAVRFGHLNP